jgi:hypothetical protein
VLFNEELVQFFAQAELGPVVEGEFTTKTDLAGNTKRVPDTATLRPTQIPLNAVLFFTRPIIFGQRNPLYGMIPPGTLTPLFALHAYYSNMPHPNDPTRLRASEEMRGFLRGTINTIIQRDEDKLRANPSEQIEVFDPENFLYAHFSRLISAGGIRPLTPEELEAMTPEVTRVYGPLFPGAAIVTPEMVLRYQQDQVALARAYKNQFTNQQVRARRQHQQAAQNPLQIQQQFLLPQVQPTPQQVLLPQVQQPPYIQIQQILQDPNLTPEQKTALINQLTNPQ